MLAQTYWKQTDPQDTKTFLIVVGVILFLIVAYNVIKKLASGSPLLSNIRATQGFSKGAFRRRAVDTGFSDAEAEFLEHYARKIGVSGPQSVFGSRTQLNNFIKNTFKYIERHADTEEGAEEQKGRLFSIREALQLRLSSGSPARSTRQLKTRTPLSLVTTREAHYSSILALNEQRAMYVEPALDAFGVPIKFPRGSKLTVFFYAGNHIGYSFQTRSGGLINIDDRRLLVLSHSDNIKPMPSRRHQRREARLSCRFYLVHVHAVRDRGKVVKTIQVEKAAVPGIITDVSAGGMSMQTMSPVNAGDFIKLEFDVGGGNLFAYASVVRVSKLRNGTSMHIKFVKITRKTANEILAYVYSYD